MNRQVEDFTDGWAYIFSRTEGSGKNVKTLSELDKVNEGKPIAFIEMSSRNEDLIFAESVGHSLNRKIKIISVPFIKEQFYCLIGNSLYYIYQLDTDKAKNITYLYLESLRIIAND